MQKSVPRRTSAKKMASAKPRSARTTSADQQTLTLSDGTVVRYEPNVRALNGLKPQRVPDDGVFIGRKFTMGGWRLDASPYANEFRVGTGVGKYTLNESLQHYYNWLVAQPPLLERLESELGGGRALYCFCHRVNKQGAPSAEAHLCHGDVLVALMRRQRETSVTASASAKHAVADTDDDEEPAPIAKAARTK